MSGQILKDDSVLENNSFIVLVVYGMVHPGITQKP